ncbi:MAG TPA: hypothetical protein VK912_18780 [Longimicrobiales bacterium]|nr:hypothetical protein [Longimicrobiales bacterium]
MTDAELLRRHEPILRFTDGELFFPCPVDEYVRKCSLWTRGDDRRARLVVPHGELDLDRLSDHGISLNGVALSLRFVERPLSAREYRQRLLHPHRARFNAPGRLARVPPWSRLLDAAFDLSLLVRGTVPGGTAAAAELRYDELLKRDDRRAYYGRVVRAGGWTILHYMFFYAMNDWRSGFQGANDHEADWEQIFVYLYEAGDGSLEPRWIAYASHDEYGDGLRRRWDDPLLVREGTHPVVFVAAGSHASYFEPGEYLMGVEPRFLRPVKRTADSLRRLWIENLGQGLSESVDRKLDALVSIPFVDYARGDGRTIGPGGDAQWVPIVISNDVAWVSHYRGLWGLDTQDPFGGERAPAGPKYNRDGSVRLSWYDPVGFAGLEKVLPPPQVAPALEARQRTLTIDIERIDDRIARVRQLVQTRALDEAALRASQDCGTTYERTAARLAAAEEKLRALKQQRTALAQTHEFVRRYANRVHEMSDDPHTHLDNPRRPDPTPPPRRVFQVWSALSGAFALLIVVLLLLVLPAHWWVWLLVAAIVFFALEAAAEGRLLSFLSSFAIVLAVISAGVLVWEFWRALVVVALGGAIAVLTRDNLRELYRTPPPARD